jgi:hypothetical protein
MKKALGLVLLAGVAVTIFATTGAGGSAQLPAKTEAAQVPRDTNMVALSTVQDMARFGRGKKSATILIAAAEMLSQIPTRPFPADSLDKKPEGTVGAAPKSAELTTATLLADAKRFAGSNQDLLNTIAALEKRIASGGTRQAVGGPKRDVDVLAGRGQVTYTIRFVEGRVARVGVIGDGDTDLDLYIFDGNGNLIVKDDDYTDQCIASWIPSWTGPFRVVIVNRGPIPNRYTMLTS